MGILTNPSHPGEDLDILYLKPLGMVATALAKHLDVLRTRIARLLKCRASVTIDTTLYLARIFSTTQEIWMNIQHSWDLAQARKSIDVSEIVQLGTNRYHRVVERSDGGKDASVRMTG